MIYFPYAKYLNAVMATEQSAGVLIASEEMADRLGVPTDKRVYWRGGAFRAENPWNVSERPSFSTSPAIQTCHRTALANAGIELDDIDLIDFYSCFPIAVAMACEMLGLAQDDPRGFSITGGLPYAGGPGSSYSFHSLATAIERLQSGSANTALLTGNGWYLTKHSATILAREPSAGTPTAAANEALVTDWSENTVEIDKAPEGAAQVETYTIGHERDGTPNQGLIIGRLESTNARFLANTPADPSLLAELEAMEVIGTKGSVTTIDDQAIYTPA
jgi:acetyl-CoA C-acetyltransferase